MEKEKSVIRQMYYGQAINKNNIVLSEQGKLLSDKVMEIENQILEKLRGQDKICKLFEEFNQAVEALHSEHTDTVFEEGFKCGLLIGIEAGESKFA